MEIKVIFRDIQNNILYSEVDLYKFFDYLIKKYNAVIKNKKVIISLNENFSSFYLETDKFTIALSFWEKINICYIYISHSKDPFIIYNELKELLKPKYWSVSEYKETK
ncbi:MAG: hypothetical protein ACP5G1_01295 [Nanopusillaceae archaeon]